MAEVEIGYLCRHGHFVFYRGDEDVCGSKQIGKIVVHTVKEYDVSDRLERAIEGLAGDLERLT